MTWLNFIALACGTWYLSYCLVTLDGPFGWFERIRKKYPLAGLTGCIYCLSFWVGIALYGIVYNGIEAPVHVLGAIGAAHMLASYTGANYGNQDGDGL